MSVLEELFTKYGTDKGIWGYTEAYERYLGKIRPEIKKVLEIGICGFRDIPNNVVGASLFAWRDYFPNAQVFGIDYDKRFIFNDQERISTMQCDAYDQHQLWDVMDAFGGDFDLIIDDAVHDPLPQLNLLCDLFPYLSDTGIYAIEDVCPYKVPNGDLIGIYRHFPQSTKIEEFKTHKDERLIIVSR